MAKKLLEIRDFSGGLNCYSDARDIDDTQFAQNWNAVVDHAGIIRVAGMGESFIQTEAFSVANAQDGYGLFQFSSDYTAWNIDGAFNSGFKMGTLSAGASTTATLESTAPAKSEDYYEEMTIFIYEGTGKGQSRKITASSTAAPPVLTISSGSNNWDTTPDNTSKYMIYRWTPSSAWTGNAGVAIEDYITNGADEAGNPTLNASISGQAFSNNYYIYTKHTSITDDQTKNLGYIEYEPAQTLVPGTKYLLSFDCAAKDKWYNDVSDGNEDGSGTTYGERVPFVTIHSKSVADTKGSVKTI